MLGRVASSIYWMARYIERAENIARFVGVNLNMVMDLPESDTEAAQWMPLIMATGDEERFKATGREPTQESVIHFLIHDETYANSILSCVRAARENARTVREVLPTEAWELINSFYLMVNRSTRQEMDMVALQDFISEIKRASHSFIGIGLTTMLHGEGWNFCRLGRLLERADKTSRLVDVKYFYLLPDVTDVGTTLDDIQWRAVLQSVSGMESYRQRHHRIRPENVMDFLLFDLEFPRSVNHCLTRADVALHAISGSSPGSYVNTPERRLGRLKSEFSYMQVADVIEHGLHEFIDNLQLQLNGVGDAIGNEYFAIKPITTTAGSQVG